MNTFLLVATPTYFLPDLKGKNNVLCLKEGNNYQIEFTVTCDPPLESSCSHFLSKKDGSVDDNRIFVNENTIQFNRANKDDAGTYHISCSNAAGPGQLSFHLEVKSKFCSSNFAISATFNESNTIRVCMPD